MSLKAMKKSQAFYIGNAVEPYVFAYKDSTMSRIYSSGEVIIDRAVIVSSICTLRWLWI